MRLPINPLAHIFLLLALIILSVPVMAQDHKNATLDVFASQSQIAAGDTITVAIRQNIRDHWHTYWVNPGDSGESLSIEWDLPSGVSVGDIQYPTPKDIFYDPLLNYGFEGAPIYLQTLTLSDDFDASKLVLKGSATWLVCQEICIPEGQNMSLTIPVGDDGKAINQSIFQMAQQAMPQQVDWITSLTKDNGVAALSIAIPQDLQNQFTDVKIYPYDWGIMETVGNVMADFEGDQIIFTKTSGTRDLANVHEPRFVIVTAANAYEVTANRLMPMSGHDGYAFLWSFIVIIAFAFIGGLILNLMPCVFPVLSMKALSLVKLSDKERKHAQASGLAYMAGIVLSFLGIASVLIGLKAVGATIGWGFQLQNPYIVLGLATLLYVIGLNLLGLFEIHGRWAGIGSRLTKGNDVKSSFFTGVLATLVATPCSAPFMATAVGYALTQNAFLSLIIFTVLGFGLAFPYVLLCFVPKFQAILPKPGAWMNTFRHILAFPMFASAIWLVWVLVQQSGDLAVLYSLGLFLSIVFLIWIFKKPVAALLKKIIAAVLLIVFIGLSPVLSTSDNFDYEVFTQDHLDQVLVDHPDQPVFVNMTAAWCITCLVNERTSLSKSTVQQVFADEKVIYMKGDWTNQNADITQFLEFYGRNGVPLYVYYGRANKNGVRPDPVILPQVLTPSIVIETVKGNKE